MTADDLAPDISVRRPTPADERRGPRLARRESDRRVLALIDEMSDAFLSVDPEWRITYANRQAARLNGTTPEALVGASHWERWPETVGSEVERHYRRAMAERAAVQFEHYYPVAAVWHDVRVYPADDGGLAIFYRDITAQKLLELERARQARELADAHEKAHTAEMQVRLLVDRVRDYAVFLMDPDGTITHWGIGAERMKGWRPEEVIGRNLRDLYPEPPPDDGGPLDHLRYAARHGEYIGEGMRRKKNGETFLARVVLTALRRDGELIGYSKITQDLTREREREQTIQAAMRATEAANLAKSQFLANTSHEIRTPLNAIIGYAELLEIGVAGALGPLQRQYLDRIQSTSRHLLTLVNDVIDLSKIESGAIEATIEPVVAADAVESAAQFIEPQARARGVAVRNACARTDGTILLGDPERVRQVLVNLLSNAVRFTEAAGRVTITCGRERSAPAELHGAAPGPWAFVRVEDTGIGIAPAAMERIWEAFVQVDATHTRRVGGSGLGLTISRHLARAMGGDILAQSEPGVGSSFALWLPAAPERAGGGPDRGAGGDRGDGSLPSYGRARADTRLDATLDALPPVALGGLAEVADRLIERAEDVLAAHVRRVREDPLTAPATSGLRRTETEDHLISFISDLAQCLAAVASDGAEGLAMLRDGTAIQRVIAQRHGHQRVRLGWDEPAVRREYAILGEELRAELARHEAAHPAAVARAREVFELLLERAERETVAAMRTAAE